MEHSQGFAFKILGKKCEIKGEGKKKNWLE